MSSSSVTNNSHVARRQKPHAAVFDCDGLLVDSAHCWEHAYASVAADRGRSIHDIRLERLLGASVSHAASLVSQDLGERVSTGELRAALDESFAANLPQALPGARELVDALAVHMPLGVASNAPREVVLAVLEQLGVRKRFSAVVSAEETLHDKPHPHVYVEACRRLGVAPCDAVGFEDSALGARAARAAGLIVVMVPSAPDVHVDADLTVPSLDDARVRALLGVDAIADDADPVPDRRGSSAMSG